MARLIRDAAIAVAAGLLVAVILAVFHVHVLLVLVIALIVAISLGLAADRYARSSSDSPDSRADLPIDPAFEVEDSGHLHATVGTFEQRTVTGHAHQPIAHVGEKAEATLDFGTIKQTHLTDPPANKDG